MAFSTLPEAAARVSRVSSRRHVRRRYQVVQRDGLEILAVIADEAQAGLGHIDEAQFVVDVRQQVDGADHLFQLRSAACGRLRFAVHAPAERTKPVDDRAQGVPAGRGDPVRFHVYRWQPVFVCRQGGSLPAV